MCYIRHPKSEKTLSFQRVFTKNWNTMHESANWLGNLTFNQGNVGSNPISCTKLFRLSSMVEFTAVNRAVASSNLADGAF